MKSGSSSRFDATKWELHGQVATYKRSDRTGLIPNRVQTLSQDRL